MAGIGQAKTFWKTIRAVSVPEIAREAEKPFSITIVGEPTKREEAWKQLFPNTDEGAVLPQRSLIQSFDTTSPEDGFPAESDMDTLVIDAGGGRSETLSQVPVYSVDELGGWDRVLERLLDARPDLALSMARRFPGLRPLVSDRIVKDTAMANAEFAMLNALPGVVPIIAPLLPAAAIGDIFMLTKNQAMMLFRLAAAHDLPLDMRARSRDLAPLLGNAFGWRAIAREVVGIVPGGLGLVARGAIAYAGTIALGRGIQKLYETGKQPTKAQIAQYYREAYAGAKEIVRERLQILRGRKRKDVPVLDTPLLVGVDENAKDANEETSTG